MLFGLAEWAVSCAVTCLPAFSHRVWSLLFFFLSTVIFWIKLTPLLSKEMKRIWDTETDLVLSTLHSSHRCWKESLTFLFCLSDADLQIGKLMWGDSGLYYCLIITPDDVEGKNEESVELLVLGKPSCQVGFSAHR